MENYVSRQEHEEFARRIDAENDRQNHRLRNLEETVKEISNLTAATQKLADNMENMLKIQERQEKRLEQIEGRDGEKWRKMLSYIGTAILGAVLAIVFAKIGL